MNIKKVFIDGITYLIPKNTKITVSDGLKVSLTAIKK